MVEALVAIPLFITVFALLLYVGNLYAQKQRTMREARQRAWSYAMHDCQGSEPDVSQQGAGTGSLGDIQGQIGGGGSPVDPNQYNGDPLGGQTLSGTHGVAVATSKSQAQASQLAGGFSQKLSTTTRVTCNEAIHDGDPVGMISYAWDLMKQF
jgi:hypothetical protein